MSAGCCKSSGGWHLNSMKPSSKRGCLCGSLLLWFLFWFSLLLSYQSSLGSMPSASVVLTVQLSPLASGGSGRVLPSSLHHWEMECRAAPAKTIGLIIPRSAALNAAFVPAWWATAWRHSLLLLRAIPALTPLDCQQLWDSQIKKKILYPPNGSKGPATSCFPVLTIPELLPKIPAGLPPLPHTHC